MRILLRLAVVCTICLILLVRVQTRERSLTADSVSMHQQVIELLEASPARLRKNSNDAARTSGQFIYFTVPGCQEPLAILPYHFMRDATALASRVDGVQGELSYHFLGRSWDEQNKLQFGLTLVWQRLTYNLGLSDMLPKKTVLLLIAPQDCKASPHLDLATVWPRYSET